MVKLPPIFPPTVAGARTPGQTAVGSIRFEQARKRLAHLVSREVEHVGDADVVEYLSRGDVNVRAFLIARTSAQE
jgi:hypothetical protein